MLQSIKACVVTFGLFFVLSSLSACSTLHYGDVPPSVFAKLPADLPRQIHLDVAFFPQKAFHCGPAALAGIFHYHGIQQTPETLSDWVYLPNRKGSLQIEMLGAIRRAELIPYQLDAGLTDLLQMLADQQPVLVLQNLSFQWWPQWHYAIAIGYDLDQQQIILHSGGKDNYRISMATFLNTWERADNWAIAPLDAQQLPAHLDSRLFIKAVGSLESTGHVNTALLAYQQGQKRWPEEPLIAFGLGNTQFQLKQYPQALRSFRQAITLDERNAFFWNNLAYGYLALGCQQKARNAIEHAIELAPNDQAIQASVKEVTAMPATIDTKNINSACHQAKIKTR